MNISSFIQKIERRVISFAISFQIISDSKQAFNDSYASAVALFSDRYTSYDFKKYVLPQWLENTTAIENFFKTHFTFSFLRNQIIKRTMFAHLTKTATDIQKNLLRSTYSSGKLHTYLKEHSTGAPILNDFEFQTSGNSIHHLYHIAKFEKETGVTFSTLSSIVELGGGYGNFAKIAKKMNPGITYTIIDIPVFAYMQLVYLTTIFGKDSVALFDATVGIVEGKINIVPFHEPTVQSLSTYFSVTPDVFVSTWALSESNEATQALMQEVNYFNATHLLLAYQKANELFKYAENIGGTLTTYKILYSAETEYLSENYYLFAKKS